LTAPSGPGVHIKKKDNRGFKEIQIEGGGVGGRSAWMRSGKHKRGSRKQKKSETGAPLQGNRGQGDTQKTAKDLHRFQGGVRGRQVHLPRKRKRSSSLSRRSRRKRVTKQSISELGARFVGLQKKTRKRKFYANIKDRAPTKNDKRKGETSFK